MSGGGAGEASAADAALRARIEARVGEASGSRVAVRTLDRLAGGACQDNYAAVLSFDGGELSGERKLVLRSDANTSLPGSLDRAKEFDVIRAAVERGVRTPTPRWLTRGLTRESSYAYFLDWAEGDAIGRRVVAGPKLEKAREGLAAECAIELAKIHSITPETHPDLFAGAASQASTDDPAEDAITFTEAMIDRMHEPRPALELALLWLRTNRPARAPMTLVHGDFRTGNFMVTPAGLSAVLDWEFAHWGAPAEDLAWISVRDWRFGQLRKPVGGFASRAAFYEAYERASGTRVDRREVHYWEVMGNVRWAAASIHQGERYMSGGDADIELVAVARRAVEMEWEALRLIDVGVS